MTETEETVEIKETETEEQTEELQETENGCQGYLRIDGQREQTVSDQCLHRNFLVLQPSRLKIMDVMCFRLI